MGKVWKFYERKGSVHINEPSEYFAMEVDKSQKEEDYIWVGYYFYCNTFHSMFGVDKRGYQEIDFATYQKAINKCFSSIKERIISKSITLQMEEGYDGYITTITASENVMINAIKRVTHWRTKNESILGRFNALGVEERACYISRLSAEPLITSYKKPKPKSRKR